MLQKNDEYLVNLSQQQPNMPMEQLRLDLHVSLQMLMDEVGRRKG